MQSGSVSEFLRRHFRHFNAATVIDAADAYRQHLANGGKMFLAMAGAMSTAELGLSLAEMIRQDKIHGVSCTGANLEEDVFNLVAHKDYERVPNYADLSPADEQALLDRKMNRVTDTCIPENVMRSVERVIVDAWQEADRNGERKFPHEFFYKLLRERKLESSFQIDLQDSWLYAAMEKDLPIFVPGWEDSTTGNFYAVQCMTGKVKNIHTVKTGMEYMMELSRWYPEVAQENPVGFFQIGGGIAGDFPICVVPLLRQDMQKTDTPMWGYFCQIGDSTTSYGSYSGAVPNEKITWGKLDADTPRFMIESDATIVAPLIFAQVLEW